MAFKYGPGDLVRVTTTPGQWRVSSPSPYGYWLKPSDDVAKALASTLKYGMLEARTSELQSITQTGRIYDDHGPRRRHRHPRF